MVGSVDSTMATVNVHDALTPWMLTAEHVTVLVPSGKAEPDTGRHDVVGVPYMSMAVAAYVAVLKGTLLAGCRI